MLFLKIKCCAELWSLHVFVFCSSSLILSLLCSNFTACLFPALPLSLFESRVVFRAPLIMQFTASSSLSWARTQCASCSPALSHVRVGLSRSVRYTVLRVRLRRHLLAEYEQSVSFGLLVRCSSGWSSVVWLDWVRHRLAVAVWPWWSLVIGSNA